MITHDRLKEVLEYDEYTGVFRWKIKPARYIAVGAVAGGVISTTGYIKIIVDKKQYLAHRLAWLYVTGEMPIGLLDHINGKIDDNRFVNLRPCSYSQNMANSKLLSTNTSGYKGVGKIRDKWRARGKKDGREYHLGTFNTAEEAAAVARAFAEKHHGEFARHE